MYVYMLPIYKCIIKTCLIHFCVYDFRVDHFILTNQLWLKFGMQLGIMLVQLRGESRFFYKISFCYLNFKSKHIFSTTSIKFQFLYLEGYVFTLVIAHRCHSRMGVFNIFFPIQLACLFLVLWTVYSRK